MIQKIMKFSPISLFSKRQRYILYTQNNQLQLNKYKQRQNAHMDCIPLATHVFEPGVYFMGDYEH